MTQENTDPELVDLKTAREASGLSLKELFERTRISVANLEAMENSNFHLLPVAIYTRNFIKTYTQALGVESEPVLLRYENYLQAKQMKEQAQKTVQPKASPLGVIWHHYRVYVWIGCLVIVFASVSFFVSYWNKTDEKTQIAQTGLTVAEAPELPEVAILTEPESKIQNPVAEGVVLKSEKAPEAPKSISPDKKMAGYVSEEEPSVMTIRATEETWIRIVADDQESFQVLLKPGEKTSHKGSRFSMDIGNAGGIKINFNGKTFENLGKSGQVIHMRLP